MENKQLAMKEKPVLPLLLSLAMPVSLSMVIQSLYNIIDSVWVAKLGTQALTAVSLAFPLQNIILSVGVGMGIGVGSVISMDLGAGDRDSANRAASVGMGLTVFHCLLFILLGVTVTRPFLSLFTHDETTLQWACDYSSIVLCLSFGHLLQMCLEKIFQGTGHMKATMYLVATGCIINLVLDPVLIFGWFGLPAMGIRGAAWATVIGQIGAFLAYLLVLRKKDIGVFISLRWFRPDRQLLRRIYSIGIPSSLMMAMPSFLVGILNGILAQFSAVYVAVFGLYFKLQTFINLPSSGVVQGMRPIIGYNYGAGEHRRVRETIRYSLYLVAAIMAVGTVAALGFPTLILQAFDADAQLLSCGVPALRIIGLSFLPSTVGIVCAGVFEALGRGRESLLISLVRQFAVIIPLGWVLSRFLGPVGIWITFPMAEIAASMLAARLLHRTDVFMG